MFDQFSQIVVEASAWAYAAILVLAAADAVIPLVPSETVLITAGVIAASQEPSALPLAVSAGALGAFAGDNLAYALGRRYGRRTTRRLLRGDKSQRRIDWATRQLDRQGAVLITAGRFVPGGRTAVTVAAGLTGFPWRRFAVYDAIAAFAWAAYSVALGYFGGRTFEHQPWKGFVLALGIASALTAGTWAARRVKRAPASGHAYTESLTFQAADHQQRALPESGNSSYPGVDRTFSTTSVKPQRVAGASRS